MKYREAKRYKVNDAINLSGEKALSSSNLMITKITDTGKIITFEAYSPVVGTIVFDHKKAHAPILAIVEGKKALWFKVHDVKPSDLAGKIARNYGKNVS